MKTFITIKVGYTSGMYGCSGEYFNTIIIWGSKVKNITFEGMYGADYRIAEALKARGFTETHLRSDYGKMAKKDMLRIFVSESEAINTIKKMKKAS
jgi:hypothetical protein